MRGLRNLGMGDILTIALAIAVGNAITIGLFAALGVSSVPSGIGILGLISGFLVVVLGLTLVSTIVVFVFTYLSYQFA